MFDLSDLCHTLKNSYVFLFVHLFILHLKSSVVSIVNSTVVLHKKNKFPLHIQTVQYG